MVVEVLAETPLLVEPDELSPNEGMLPEGTLLRLLGKRNGAFENVEVELTDRVAEGWVRRRALNLKRQEIQNEKWEEREKKNANNRGSISNRQRREGPLYIPKDEQMLIRREVNFFYGLILEFPFNYAEDTAGNLFSGFNYRLGVHGGFYVSKGMPLRFELTYSRLGGAADAASPAGAGAALEVGFVDMRTQLEYEISNFSLLGYLQYSFGAGVGTAPTSTAFGSVSDLSSIWAGLGGGYRVRFNDSNVLHLQLAYGLSLLRSPVGFQAFGLRLMWEIRG